MSTFSYKARSQSGSVESGMLIAASKKAAMLSLLRQGLQPTAIEEKAAGKKKRTTTRQASGNDIILFTEELGELLNAGLPLEPALASMANREEEGPMKEISMNLRALVTDGIPFSKALEQVSDRFDELYRNLITAGEASGSLGSIVREHAIYMKEQAAIRNSLLMALLYPGFLLLACLGAISLFLFYLLPQISELLTSTSGGDMPFGIRLSMTLSAALTTMWPILIILVVILILGTKALFMIEKNKVWWDEAKIGLPFYGKIFQYGFFVQWLKTLSNLLMNGVPLAQGLALANQTVPNRFYREKLFTVVEQVKDGIKLTTAMKQATIFPTSMIDLIAVGDETGRLSRSVKRAADYYETKLRMIMNSLISILTPVMLIGMALVVGALCYTLIQAIYESIGKMREQ